MTMKKYKNISGRNVGFVIDGKTYDFQNGEIMSVPDEFKEKIEYSLKMLEDLSPAKEETPIETKPIETPKPKRGRKKK